MEVMGIGSAIYYSKQHRNLAEDANLHFAESHVLAHPKVQIDLAFQQHEAKLAATAASQPLPNFSVSFKPNFEDWKILGCGIGGPFQAEAKFLDTTAIMIMKNSHIEGVLQAKTCQMMGGAKSRLLRLLKLPNKSSINHLSQLGTYRTLLHHKDSICTGHSNMNLKFSNIHHWVLEEK